MSHIHEELDVDATAGTERGWEAANGNGTAARWGADHPEGLPASGCHLQGYDARVAISLWTLEAFVFQRLNGLDVDSSGSHP